MSSDVIQLGVNDAAIVFSEDGETELRTPCGEEGEMINLPTINVLRCIVFLDNEELVAQVDQMIKENRRK